MESNNQTDTNKLVHGLIGGDDNDSQANNLGNNPPPTNEAITLAELQGVAKATVIKTKEDALKHIQEMEAQLPGALQKAAEYDKLVKSKATPVAPELNQAQNIAPVNEASEVAKLREEFQREQLLRKYPESENVLDTITKLAKSDGTSLTQVYETHLKDFVVAKLQAEKAANEEKNVSVSSKQRMGSAEAGEVNQAAKAVMDNRNSTEAKENLVRKVLFSK